jgi:23S rRNA (adenine1618-N6)-methyltransferase
MPVLTAQPRLNYILWLQDLLDSTSPDYRDGYDPDRDVTGLDMYVTASEPSLAS